MHWAESTHFIPVYSYFWNLTEQLAGLIYWELSIGLSFSSESVSILRYWDTERISLISIYSSLCDVTIVHAVTTGHAHC